MLALQQNAEVCAVGLSWAVFETETPEKIVRHAGVFPVLVFPGFQTAQETSQALNHLGRFLLQTYPETGRPSPKLGFSKGECFTTTFDSQVFILLRRVMRGHRIQRKLVKSLALFPSPTNGALRRQEVTSDTKS